MPDAASLARIQFAFTVELSHYLSDHFNRTRPLSGRLRGLWLKTRDALYLQIYKFWLNVFAMALAFGVVTGIVLSFELASALPIREAGRSGYRPNDRA